MKRLALLLLLAFLALAVWFTARGCRAGDPVERLVADMVQIPGRDYRMGKYEVTQAQWEAVMGDNPSNFKNPDNPVERVSWDDCQEFLKKLNSLPSVDELPVMTRGASGVPLSSGRMRMGSVRRKRSGVSG